MNIMFIKQKPIKKVCNKKSFATTVKSVITKLTYHNSLITAYQFVSLSDSSHQKGIKEFLVSFVPLKIGRTARKNL